MKRVLFWILIIFSWVSQAQDRWVLNSENSFITYEASHFLHDWSGTNQNVRGLLIGNHDFFKKIAIAMYVRDFDSKNSNRDNNALEILEVLQFPKIEFFSEEIEWKDNEIKFGGELNFHGIELRKKITAKANLKQNNLLLEGNFDLTLSDFEVPLPSFMLRKMKDEIIIKYQLYFKKLER
ncbi:MAG: YceI family protein [Bacteroidota bacterium]|nr:YceI family protein [Bacteroidota bacterium]